MNKQCPNCTEPHDLLLDASRLYCWWCGYVEDAAISIQSNPDFTPQQKSIWGLIGFGVLIYGLYKFGTSVGR